MKKSAALTRSRAGMPRRRASFTTAIPSAYTTSMAFRDFAKDWSAKPRFTVWAFKYAAARDSSCGDVSQSINSSAPHGVSFSAKNFAGSVITRDWTSCLPFVK